MNIALEQHSGQHRSGMSYARARLWLGISTVGTFVTLSTLLLIWDIPSGVFLAGSGSFIHQSLLMGVVIAFYALLHLPFDLLGGVVLPARFGRLESPIAPTLTRLARGVLVHSLMLWGFATLLLTAGWFTGLIGIVLIAGTLTIALIAGRPLIARLVGSVRLTREDPSRLESADSGFTGGICGLPGSARILTPARWHYALDSQQLDRALHRRRVAVSSGSWRRGQIFAVVFTIVGITLAGLAAGPDTLSTAAGLTTMALWFTLWSFIGLLTLPTLSRWAVARADAGCGLDPRDGEVLSRIDQMGDDEPTRSRWIETIFHPVPSVSSRVSSPCRTRPAYWDVARTSLYCSAAGIGLLGRAVHCNCGRPALWVFLPSA